MKHLFLAGATAAMLIAGSSQAYAKSDKRDVVANYDFSGFDKIEIAGVYELDIQAGNRFSVRTEATQKQAKRLRVELDGDTLVLARNEESKSWKNKNNNDGSVLVIVTMPRLTDLEVAGVATGEISAFTGGSIDIDIAGVGDLTLSGTCDELDIDVAGVGEVDARDLKCDHVDADLGGVGELSVYASESVDASAGGIGSIDVYGDPEETHIDDGFMAKVKMR